MNLVSKFFTAREIASGATAVSGLAGEMCYLLEGETGALLIDTLTGAGNIRAFVRELTDLPVTTVLTHGHWDHASGAFDFPECRIHPFDIPVMYDSPLDDRMNFANSLKNKKPDFPCLHIEDFTLPKPVKTIPLYDGRVFDLGGRKIETIHVPGHTKGSLVFLDSVSRAIFTGDACQTNTQLFLPDSTTVEEYRESLVRLKTFSDRFDVLYGGHSGAAVPGRIIDEAVELCGLIMVGRDDADETDLHERNCYYAKKRGVYCEPLDGTLVNIAYKKEGILRQK
ncbi:MAG: MBL fold metallo-hydrolase [Spirochaetaceae bacterium]|jgi:glyoxylase-like metal-dependent hydrolase (beta-lactamase superfamily II)|nr:MBL fold metallo-hydrolase [Spirochaetaceae bacterium]